MVIHVFLAMLKESALDTIYMRNYIQLALYIDIDDLRRRIEKCLVKKVIPDTVALLAENLSQSATQSAIRPERKKSPSPIPDAGTRVVAKNLNNAVVFHY